MDAELARWAAERAPHLLARAEDEAVALLRDALVASALGNAPDHVASDRPESRPSGGDREAAERREVHRDASAEGELLWAYCVTAADSQEPVGLRGIDETFPVERIEHAGLVVLVSRVARAEFGADALRENLNQLPWLERVARAHEAVLEAMLEQSAIVPLRLCTLYESADGVRRMLDQERAHLARALDALAGREEWAVKLLVEPRRLTARVRETDGEAIAMAEQVDGQSEGGAYMLRRRLERHLREQADVLADGLATDLRGRLELAGVDFVTRPPQNRELAGYVGEMLLNAACLVDRGQLEQLRGLVGEFETHHEDLGARVEISGPWPPYNFVVGSDPATLA
jgi:hypothetical protein